ncbi:mechanosensitive ion channel family protein [Mucilaginibacter ginkgonis]|uniref:Mechanosensitive ion channel n=1 Tax=Mucilaginibacter ginkgonis TaxID=2682091 RepID=A0A6I4I0Y8_9SPHI|nr:mechanosensitive ion channel domain-containing protein [Mucilaginibacter ginkgonis]QQL48771.1 mechanosensitive ion channel [Mucilaginibacter ginkgonis]
MDLQLFYSKASTWIIDKGPKLIVGIIIFFIGLWIIRVIRNTLKKRMTRNEVHSTLQPFFLSLSITALYLILIILVMEIVGIELTIFTTVIGAATVAAGLALSGTLQNFAGGILILLLKPFDLDDNILAQGQDGTVTSIQVFYTEILTPDNKTVIIPNGKLFNEVITNVSRKGTRRIDIEIKLGYAADSDEVIAIITKCVAEIKDILASPKSIVGVFALDVDGIRYTLKVWVKPQNFLRVKLELQGLVIRRLRAAGIKLPGM